MKDAATTARLVTSPARGGIAVIVLTGPGAGQVLRQIFRPRRAWPGSGQLALGWIVAGRERLDEAVVSLQPGSTEINIHGGPHVGRKVLALLGECGVKIVADDLVDPVLAAGKGPFDNPAVAREVLAALRSATTALAASALTAQWSGGISALACSSRPDADELRRAAAALGLMKWLLEPAEVVIAGPPNAGKSALANALVGRRVSVVSDTPGTTRDWVRSLTELSGVPVWLTDTAGLWQRPRGVEAEAVRRAWQRIESAQVVICLVPPGEAIEAEHGPMLSRLRGLGAVLEVAGKSDLGRPAGGAGLAVSARNLAGLDALREAIRRRLGFERFDPASAMAFTHRQAELLAAAAEAMDRGGTRAARSALAKLLAGGR